MMMPNIPVRALLLASLVLNAFLVGLLFEHFDRHRPFVRTNVEMRGPGSMADRMTRGLSPADAQILKDSFAVHQSAIRQADETLRGFPDRMRAIMAAPMFDAAALTQLLQGVHAARDARDDAMMAAIVEAAGKMSPEGRKNLPMGGGRPMSAQQPPPPPGQ